MKMTLNELRTLIHDVIKDELVMEAIRGVKLPQTPEQKQSFLKLMKWVAEKMQVPQEVIRSATGRAIRQDDWSEAMEVVRDYYIMKGIKGTN